MPFVSIRNKRNIYFNNPESIKEIILTFQKHIKRIVKSSSVLVQTELLLEFLRNIDILRLQVNLKCQTINDKMMWIQSIRSKDTSTEQGFNLFKENSIKHLPFVSIRNKRNIYFNNPESIKEIILTFQKHIKRIVKSSSVLVQTELLLEFLRNIDILRLQVNLKCQTINDKMMWIQSV